MNSTEFIEFRDSDALNLWAQRISLKNQLTTLDAQELETAFAAKLNESATMMLLLLSTGLIRTHELRQPQRTDDGKRWRQLRKPSGKPEAYPSPKLNGVRVPRPATGQNGSADRVTSQTAVQPVTPLSKPVPNAGPDHLKFISTQPCSACGRSPSDPHHLRLAQRRALGRKVSDEFTSALQASPLTWWQLNVDPLDRL